MTIIGNLTNDPELRTTTSGKNVCNFTVAVNRPRRNGEDQGADFFHVSAWNESADNCAKYLAKGRKVCVIGEVSVRAYSAKNGDPAASMEVKAREVEFLSQAAEKAEKPVKKDDKTGFEEVKVTDLPF